MNHYKRVGRLVVVALALLLLATACSSDSGEPDEALATTTTPGQSDTSSPADTSSPDDTEPPAVEGTLTVALTGDLDNFDPSTNQLIAFQYAIANTVFNTLVGYDSDLNVVSELAQASINDDATEFTFDLVDGAMFHDGTPVDSAAVVASLQRTAGLESVFAAPLQRVTDYGTPDSDTVVLTVDAPFAAFLDDLAKISIVAPSSFDDAVSSPVGSGPFRFVSWTPNDRIILERNDSFWGDAPAFDTLVLRPIEDPQVALANLNAGDVDIIVEAATAVREQVDTSRATVVTPPASNSIGLIEMMGTTGTLADVRLRQALAHAFDRETIKQVAFGGEGDSVWSPIPVGSWAYAEQEGYAYDLERAAELVAEVGAEGTTVGLEILTGFPEAEQMARVWQSSLAEIGIDLDIRVSELSVWLDRYVTRNYDMTWNFFGVSSDPHSFFTIIMTAHLQDQYDNPEMEQLIVDGIATANLDQRKPIYAELQKMMVDDLPVMTLQSRPIGSIVSNGVDGYQLNAIGWGLFDEITIGN